VNDAVRTTLADIVLLLRERRLPFAVIGGIAATVWGEPRFTADIDVVVGIDAVRAIDWEYLLRTGADVQEALGQDLLAQLEKLRDETRRYGSPHAE